jgi:tRNA dimethylallyltransferase
MNKKSPKNFQNFCILISGPTGTGKSDLAIQLGQFLPIEIVNADIGSFYKPLTIGTAKPDWKKESTPHHFFDIIDQPVDWTAPQFRIKLTSLIEEIWSRGNIPVIVGGSVFYIQSFFYKNREIAEPDKNMITQLEEQSAQELWTNLYAIDPQRAQKIGPTDHYRLVRALAIWYSCQEKPSEFQPIWDPLSNFCFVNVSRDREQLYAMIDQRVKIMIERGWMDEVRSLSHDPVWVDFLCKKKMIGYDLLLDYLQGNCSDYSFEQIIAVIQQKTRNYAKRQVTFLKKLTESVQEKIRNDSRSFIIQGNLTQMSSDAIIASLVRDIERLRQN